MPPGGSDITVASLWCPRRTVEYKRRVIVAVKTFSGRKLSQKGTSYLCGVAHIFYGGCVRASVWAPVFVSKWNGRQ